MWARTHDAVLLTCDLDFGAILAASRTEAPSEEQLRMDDLMSDAAVALVAKVIGWYAADLAAEALVSVDAERARARVLPLR